LTPEQRQTVADKLEIARKFMSELQQDVQTRPKHQDPKTSIEEIDRKLRGLKAEVDPIFATPKPKAEEPAKQEEKPAEPKPDEPMPEQPAQAEEPKPEQQA